MGNVVLSKYSLILAVAEQLAIKQQENGKPNPYLEALQVMSREIERQDEEITALKAQLAAQADKVKVIEMMESMGREITLRHAEKDEWYAYLWVYIEDYEQIELASSAIGALQALKTKMEA